MACKLDLQLLVVKDVKAQREDRLDVTIRKDHKEHEDRGTYPEKRKE
jgi:hypothetical protein